MDDKRQVILKKYANRRLYDSGLSRYVTLRDVEAFVRAGHDVLVYDDVTNKNITRSVLAQIFLEKEVNGDRTLLPVQVLRQLICLYGDVLRDLAPAFLQMSLEGFVKDQEKLRERATAVLRGQATPGAVVMEALAEQTRRNMRLFNESVKLMSQLAFTSPTVAAGDKIAGLPIDGLPIDNDDDEDEGKAR
jgi:polyhydroxyalkanoate synthesis repressor PhaR